MAQITAKDVAALRAKTGLGMMDCKKALVEAEGDVEAAVKILREKGLATAAKKEGRIAAEGIVDILKVGDTTAMIEVNSETDFVAKNDSFKEFVKGLLKTIIETKPATVEELATKTYSGTAQTVQEELTEKIAQIGEKLSIRRFVIVEGTTTTYIHGMGQTGVIVKFNADDAAKNNAGFAEATKNVALQIAAGNPPSYVSKEDVPAAAVEEELEAAIFAFSQESAESAGSGFCPPGGGSGSEPGVRPGSTGSGCSICFFRFWTVLRNSELSRLNSSILERISLF